MGVTGRQHTALRAGEEAARRLDDELGPTVTPSADASEAAAAARAGRAPPWSGR